jgi:hypothetical protein
MTSKSFRRSRRRQRKSRRGGNLSLMNAASVGALPIGLTLLQQHYKNKTARKTFNPVRKFGKYMTPKN